MLILNNSDLYRSEEDYESLIGLLQYVDEEDLDPVFMWHLAFALGQEERDKEAQHFFESSCPSANARCHINTGSKSSSSTYCKSPIKLS